MIKVDSYQELISGIKGKEKAFLLLYKKGNEKSDCAFSNILSGSEKIKNVNIFYADVTSVRDIHEKYDISTVPALLEFRDGVFINIIKGCIEANQYKACFEDKIFHAERKDGEKPAKRVTVYSTPTCSWCNTLKTYLKLHNVLYNDIDVSRDQRAAEALVKRSGQTGVPQTDINGEIIVGFNKARINQLLGING
ncbi:MAG TPA: glutaredoxin domain-containing protein [Bacteroidales bacterium]|nr:glutaredoxin domain-containing protein [Bacteroidales bacterium]